jgi:hypothetical protein
MVRSFGPCRTTQFQKCEQLWLMSLFNLWFHKWRQNVQLSFLNYLLFDLNVLNIFYVEVWGFALMDKSFLFAYVGPQVQLPNWSRSWIVASSSVPWLMPWALYIDNIGYSPTLRTILSNTLKYWSCGVLNQKCWGRVESSFIVPPLRDCWQLDAQHNMFKLCMKNNSKATMESLFDLNHWLALGGQFTRLVFRPIPS